MTLLSSRPAPDPASNSDKPWLLQHLALLVGLTSVAFIAVRLLSVSAGNPETAFAILQAEGTGSVVVGSLISGIGLIAVPIAIAAFRYGVVLFRRARKSATMPFSERVAASLGIVTLAVFISYFATPVMTFLAAAGGWLLIFFMALAINRRALRRKGRKPSLRECLPSIWAMAIVYLLLALTGLTVASDLWVPPQNIVLRGHPVFSAYIVSQTSDATVILTLDHALVRQIQTGQILSQEICQPSGHWLQQETLSQFVNSSKDSYPRCARDYHS